MEIKEIALNKIEIVENCRTSIRNDELVGLMRSIKQHGLKEPIGVSKNGGAKYRLLYGHRRLEAFKKLGYKDIPCVINERGDTATNLITNLIENCHREDITPQELGRICIELIKLGLNKAEIAVKLDLPESKINTGLDLIKSIPQPYLNKIRFMNKGQAKKGNIPAHVANQVVNIRRNCNLTKTQMSKLMEAVHQNELNSEETELIGFFIKDGYSIKDSINKSKEYKIVRAEFYMKHEDLETLKEKHKDTLAPIIKKIIYGELPALKRPEFERVNE